MAKQEETQTMEEYLLSQLNTPVILKDGTMMKKKEYQKRKDENLARWCERIAAMCCGRSLNDVLKMISEVSKT